VVTEQARLSMRHTKHILFTICIKFVAISSYICFLFPIINGLLAKWSLYAALHVSSAICTG
jgi:hypothetical protein